jgi:hypothetical protein
MLSLVSMQQHQHHHRQPSRLASESPSCHPCCIGLLVGEHGCDDLPVSGRCVDTHVSQRLWYRIHSLHHRLMWRRTEQSCHGWRKTRSTEASSTSWGRCIRGKRRHRRYLLCFEFCQHPCFRSVSQQLWHRTENYLRMAADSTMFRIVKRLIALSLGVHREQLEQRIGLTWPRPFLLRPLSTCQKDSMIVVFRDLVRTWTLAS